MSDFWRLNEQAVGQYALLVAIVLAISHLVGHVLRDRLSSHSERVISFGGGLAVAYVFLKLIPEIEEAHQYLGDRIHGIILFSFLAFYLLEAHFLKGVSRNGDVDRQIGSRRSFWLHIVLSWFYTFIVVVALPRDVSETFAVAVFVSLAIGLHVVYKSYILHLHHRQAMAARGRYVLATAPLLGWLVHGLIQPSEAVFDVSIAILAGFLMQSVFRSELPSYDQARFRWLVAGAITFLFLVLVTP